MKKFLMNKKKNFYIKKVNQQKLEKDSNICKRVKVKG